MKLNYEVIGRRIKELRIEKQISQETLAEKVDLSTTYISRIETAERQASLKSLVLIAETFEVTIDYFLRDNKAIGSFDYIAKLSHILEGCSNYEERVVYEVALATKRSLNKNSDLR